MDGVHLTTQQKSRVRRAYRETFTAENHGQAVKALYDRFGELYGTSTDGLRAIIAEELKKKPEEYAALRKKVAARNAAVSGPTKQKPEPPSKPTFVYAGDPGSMARGDRVRRERAKKKAKAETTAQVGGLGMGNTPTFNKLGLRGKCPRCGNRVQMEWTGKLAKHRSHGKVCGGQAPGKSRKAAANSAGRPKKQSRSLTATCAVCMKKLGVRQTDGRMLSHPGRDRQKCSGSGRSPFEGRAGKFMKGVAVTGVVSGGLPSLGKRH